MWPAGKQINETKKPKTNQQHALTGGIRRYLLVEQTKSKRLID